MVFKPQRDHENPKWRPAFHAWFGSQHVHYDRIENVLDGIAIAQNFPEHMMSQSILWSLSYLRRLYYDLYEIQYSLTGVQRGLVLGFICDLESTFVY